MFTAASSFLVSVSFPLYFNVTFKNNCSGSHFSSIVYVVNAPQNKSRRLKNTLFLEANNLFRMRIHYFGDLKKKDLYLLVSFV